jgi:hypothetical protein
MRVDTAILQLLLTSWCAATGNVPVIMIWLICRLPWVYSGNRRPLNKIVAAATLVVALLQMIITVVFVPLWRQGDISKLPNWSYLLLMPQLDDQTALIASLIPPAVTALFMVVRWAPLTSPHRHVHVPFSLPQWAAPCIQWTTILAAALYPTTSGLAFIVIAAVSISVRAFTASLRAARVVAFFSAIATSLAMATSFAFQNRYVRDHYHGSDLVIVPFLYHLSFWDGVPFFLHLIVGGLAAVVATWICEVHADESSAMMSETASLLDSPAASLYGGFDDENRSRMQSKQSRALSTARDEHGYLRAPSGYNGGHHPPGVGRHGRTHHDPLHADDSNTRNPNSGRWKSKALDKAATAIRMLRHYMLVVPLLPVALLSGSIIFFPSVLTLSALPVVLAALLLTQVNYATFMVAWVPLLSALITAQYTVLVMHEALPPSTMRVFFAMDTTITRVIEVLVGVTMALLLAVSLHATRKYAVEEQAREASQPEETTGITVIVADDSSARLGSDANPVDRALNAHIRKPLFKRMTRELGLLGREITYWVSLIFAFIASTCRPDLDIIHAVLLFMFVFFALLPRRHVRSLWPALVAYVTMLCVYAVVMHFVRNFYDPPTFVSNTMLRWATLGTDTYGENWVAIPYFVAMFAAALEWHSLNGAAHHANVAKLATPHKRVAAARDATLLATWAELGALPSVRKWKNRLGLVVAGSIFVALTVSEPRSFFVGVFLMIFLLICVLSAYSAKQAMITVAWVVASAVCWVAMIAVSLYQFRDIRDKVDNLINDNHVCEGVEPSCSHQIGLTTTTYALAFHLAPWVVAAFVSVAQVNASRYAADESPPADNVTMSEAIRSRTPTEMNIPHPPGGGFDSSGSQLAKRHAAPQRWIRDNVVVGMDQAGESAVIVARHFSRVLVYVSYLWLLYVQADLVTGAYALFLLIGWTGKGPLMFAIVHVMFIYTYQFSFVPEVKWSLNGISIAQLCGLQKSSAQVPPRSVLVVLACFFANLLWDSCKKYFPTRTAMLQFGSRVVDVQAELVAAIGYEALVALLLILYSKCEETAAGFIVAGAALVTLNFASAATLLPSMKWICFELAIASLLMLGEYACIVFATHGALSPSDVKYGEYLALSKNYGILISAGAVVIFVQCLRGARELMDAYYSQIALTHEGHRDLHSKLAAAPTEKVGHFANFLALEGPDLDEVAPEYPTPAENQPGALVVAHRVRQLATGFVKYVPPLAVATFVYGAQRTTALGLYYVIIGAICFAFVDRLNCYGRRYWRPLMWAVGLPLLLFPPILHVPPVADYVVRNSLFVALGLTENNGNSPQEFSGAHAAILVFAVLHRRLTEHFYATRIIRELCAENKVNAERYKMLLERREAIEAHDWDSWRGKQDIASRNLEAVRKAMSEAGSKQVLLPPRADEDAPPEAHNTGSPHDNDELPTEALEPPTVRVEGPGDDDSGMVKAKTSTEYDVVASAPASPVAHPPAMSTSDSEVTTASQEHQEDEDTPLKDKIMRKLQSAARAGRRHCKNLTRSLADSAYRPQTVRQRIRGLPLWVQLVMAIGEVLKTVTLEFVVMCIFFNAAQSVTLWDVLSMIAIALVGVTSYPYPPLAFFLVIMWYTLVGIFAKAITYILVSHLPTDVQTRTVVGTLFIAVPPIRQTSGDTIHEASVDLALDCLVFVAIVLHWHIGLRNGVFLRAGESLRAAFALEGQEGDAVGTRLKMTGYGALMRYFGCVKGTGHDVYLESTLALAILMVVTCFGYYSIANDGRGNFLNSVQSDLLPGPMVAFITFAMVLMVADRAIYVLRDIFKKQLLHTAVTVIVSILVLVWHAQVQTTNFASFVMLFALSVYLCFSGYQIKFGYPVSRRSDPFTPYPESTARGIGYAIMRGVPFLSELRTLIDWSFTPTSLTFDHWLRINDVRRLVYQRKCVIVDQLTNKGHERTKGDKCGQGITRLLFLLLALIFPLIYYSTFNPSMSPNYVLDVQVDVSLTTGAPTFTQTAHASQSYPGPLGEYVARTRPQLATYNIDSSARTVQLIEINTCSAQIWPISPQSGRSLLFSLEDVASGAQPFNIGLDLTLTRESSTGNGAKTQKLSQTWTMEAGTASQLACMLNNTCPNVSFVIMPKFYDPIIFNQPGNVQFFDSVIGQTNFGKVDCSMALRTEKNPSMNDLPVRYWCLKCNSLFSRGNFPNDTYPDWDCVSEGNGCRDYNYEAAQPSPYSPAPMYFVAISENVPNTFSFIPNMGIIALYTTFVLAAGSFIRNSFKPEPDILLSEAADPQPIADLVSYLAAARFEKDFALEQSIYLDLIDLLRNPAALLEATGKQRVLYDPTHGTAFKAAQESHRRRSRAPSDPPADEVPVPAAAGGPMVPLREL